ncbi:hypothetical protein J2R98_000356 [Alkalibacillus filiformis]|uniref:Uncharacterized protein n=1 Tax=Alkalibacillus filiformis TaxID=200990 RepID=A0ABU0DQ22_9BACI|nr:hypothetical protein [Alkalibacillus filiformis]
MVFCWEGKYLNWVPLAPVGLVMVQRGAIVKKDDQQF